MRPMEGGKGADVLIAPTKEHRDYSITTRTVLKDEREAALIYQTIEAFIEDEMWEDLKAFMYFLELKLSVRGIGIEAFLQGFTGIIKEKGAVAGIKKGKWGKKKDNEQEN